MKKTREELVQELRAEFGDILVLKIEESHKGFTISTDIKAAAILSLLNFGQSLGGVACQAQGMIFMFNNLGPLE